MDIYSILASKPHKPHYLNRYISFIRRCQQRNINKSGYFEKHHICPKAKDMFPKYKSFRDHPWNLAKLTARQHFIAHVMLWKSYPNFVSCMEAIWNMKHQNKQEISSKLYEKLKIEKRNSTSLRHKGKMLSKETKSKLSEFRLGKSYDKIMGIEKSNDVRRKMRESRKGKNTGSKNSMFGRTKELHHGYGISINSGESNFMFGKKHDDAARRKMSDAKKKRDLIAENKMSLLSYDEKMRIVQFYLEHKNMKQTSLEFEISQVKVGFILRDMGYYPSGKKISEFRSK